MNKLRLGMVGLDTSHCIAFAELLNDKSCPHHVEGGQIVVAYPGGSESFSLSRNRVKQFTLKMEERFNIRIVDSIAKVAEDVDGIFLESVDGLQHLEQFKEIAQFGKPVFIDKPFATSVEDAKRIVELSEKFNAPVYSCSSIRYARGIENIEKRWKVLGCEAFGPMVILKDFPGLFWYGIHTAEVLFSKMGRGCREVIAQYTEIADVVTGIWEDSRVGTLYGYRISELGNFGCTLFTDGGILQGIAQSDPPYYAMMMPNVLEFFRSGKSPISLTETLEIIAFLEAANESRQTSKPVPIHI